jgi:hypothetical protein
MPTGSPEPADGAPARRFTLAGPLLAALLGYLAGDMLRPPERQATAHAGIAVIDAYQATLSPALGRVVHCRFDPSCSAYGREAIARYGSPRGFALAAGRVFRCHPWASGGRDPVP